MLVLKYHDAAALAELAEIAIAIAAGAVDCYQPQPVLAGGKLLTAAAAGTREAFGSQALKERSRDLEQPGLRRFCNLWNDSGSSDFADVGTDTDELELDLYFETIAELLHVLTVNKGFSKRVDEGGAALGKLYWDNLRPRREYLSSKLCPGQPLDAYGKDFLHPTVNKYLEHEHAFAMRGLPEDRAAADRIKGYLDAHFEYLKAPDGTETIIGAHRVIGRGRELGRNDGVTGLHNTGYLREWLPNVLVGNWLGFELCSDRFVNALAQTLYWHVMVDGVEHALAPNMGGGQTKDDKRTDVAHFRGGKTAKISKAKNWGGADAKQGIHAISGSNLPALAHLTGREDLRRELQLLDKTKDTEKYGRHGSRLGLLLWRMAEAGGRL